MKTIPSLLRSILSLLFILTRGSKNVVFDNLTINGRTISDTMPGKPGFYKTGDMAHFFVGEHVDDLTFRTTAPETAAAR